MTIKDIQDLETELDKKVGIDNLITDLKNTIPKFDKKKFMSLASELSKTMKDNEKLRPNITSKL